MAIQTTLGFPIERRAAQSGSTWSVSRDCQLQACERKYYFQYLAGGKINSPDPELQRIGLLKKLQTVPMWKGDCLHWSIANYLSDVREARPATRDGLIHQLQGKIQREWKFSEERRFRDQPGLLAKGGLALLEHEYDEMPATATLDSVFEEVVTMLDKFLDWASGPSDLVRKVAQADNAWIEPPAFGADAPGILVDGVQVLTKVDLAVEKSGAYFEIYDWKSKEADDNARPFMTQNELQVRVYQLWPHLTMELPLQIISAHLVYLGGSVAAVCSHRLDERAVPLTMAMVRDSIALAKRFDRNIYEHVIALQDLDYAPSSGYCRFCQFKRLCREDLSHETSR